MTQFVCTGANGFIGTHIVEALLKLMPGELGLQGATGKRGFSSYQSPNNETNVVCVTSCDLADTLTRTNASRFMKSARCEFISHDKLFAHMDAMGEKPAAIIHNGAVSSTTETDPKLYDDLNLKYTQALWEYCVKKEIPFIYASSAGVYGDGSRGFSDKKSDNAKFVPLSLYAKSKHDFDAWALVQKKRPPLWFGLRYFNVYGPFESHKGSGASMVYHGYQQITRTGKFKLFRSTQAGISDGEQLRDFVYVKDITAITLKLIEMAIAHQNGSKLAQIEDDGTFINIGVGAARSFNDLGKNIFKALNLKTQIEYIDMPLSLAKQYQNYTCAEHNGLVEVGLEHKFVTLDTGVADYVLKYLCRGL